MSLTTDFLSVFPTILRIFMEINMVLSGLGWVKWGPAPTPPEFIAFWGYRLGREKRAGDKPLPSRLAACVGVQVALQRCPILRTGK